MSTDTAISPKKREQLQQLFVRGNEQMSMKAYEYADDIYFTPCVLQDPGNPIYAKTFLANLQKKFGEKKKTTQSILAVGKKLAVDFKKPESLFKVSIETIKSNPWAVDALITAGKACFDMGHTKSAIIYHYAAIDADPYHVAANFACIAVFREAAEYEAALACIQRILKQQPQNKDARQLLQDISAEKTIHRGKYASGTSRETSENAEEDMPEHETEEEKSRPLSPIEQIERRIAKNPSDSANYIELAQLFSRQSQYADAEKNYAKAVELSNNASDKVDLLLETQKKRLHADTLRLKEEYEQRPQENLKTMFFAARKQYEEKSLELAGHRVKHHPNNTGYHFEYGLLLQKQERVHEAIAEFQAAKLDTARLGDCLLEIGRCFQMIRQYKLALTHYHDAAQALESGENKKKALYLAMKLAINMEDFSQAETYGHQLASIDFSYRDLSAMLEQIARR